MFEKRLVAAVEKIRSEGLDSTVLNPRIPDGWYVATKAELLSEIFGIREVDGTKFLIGSKVTSQP
jgi:hypothetical protein